MKSAFLTFALLGVVGFFGSQTGVADAAIKVQTVDYEQGGATLEGWLVYDDATQAKRPGVVLFPAFWGATPHDQENATRLAKMGYVAFVADMYGKGVRPQTPKDAGAESSKYAKNRPLLLARSKAALDQLLGSDLVDPAKVAAIGYCFGGVSVLDLTRSGAPLVDAVTFHGELNTPNPQDTKNVKTHVLVLQGVDDPIVRPDSVLAFENEMSAAHIDWQVVMFGGTMHSFTDNTHPDDPVRGSVYNPENDRRSWRAMTDLFHDTF